ncbi:MFS transporter [Candidatus Tisiphia endosymbiont of Ceraclea dissimilis]|uniref:MFS transporter n=1 Tax=Candidatus Tisiphia endosymbiont of Ceraclea dissimilis TaxID=3077928 RepID=UPI003CCB7176
MIGYQQEQKSLTREQKEAVGLLSIGTFLEYFDLMLYVHMTVLLNELFFPKFDPHTTKLLSALAFCSTFVFRPIGAIIFGWIGDNIGRKTTIIITTTMMALCCIIIAMLPTYAQIGITSSVVITICRIIQGMSSMGEIIGAELYMTETTQPPVQYLAVALIGCLSATGGMGALAVATLVTSNHFNWRYAFIIGACIAIIGTLARTALRESSDFANAKKQLKQFFKQTSVNEEKLVNNPVYTQKINKITALSLFLMDCTWPVCFYFLYFYCGNILKNSFGYNSEEVIFHNFTVSIVHFSSTVLLVYLSYKIYPLKIVKARLMVFWGFILVCPYLLFNIKTPLELFLIQSFFIIFRTDYSPATPIFFKYFPVFKRFTFISLSFAISRALMHVITSFGFVYLIDYFGHWGLLIIMLPTALGFAFGLSHYEKLEKEEGNYPQKLLPAAVKKVV